MDIQNKESQHSCHQSVNTTVKMGLNRRRVVVLGGGPAGLAAAWSLAKDGHHVTILEKEANCGGMAATFQRGEYSYDLGPHNFHSSNSTLLAFLQNALGDDFRPNPPKIEIYFRKKHIRHPFEGFDLLNAMNGLTALACASSFFWSRIKSIFIPVFKDDGTYRTWLINRFGKHFFDIFFGPYTEKVWGVPTSELSDIVAKKRVPVKSLFEVVKSAILRKHQFHQEHPKTIPSYYPRYGSGQVIDFFKNEFLQLGGEIITNTQIIGMNCSDNTISSIEFLTTGQPSRIIRAKPDCDQKLSILSTIPIDQLVQYMQWNVPAEIIDSANKLKFTQEVLLYININVINPLGVHWLYFSEAIFPFNRIYDIANFSSDMVPSGKTTLCLEITCAKNDPVWNMDDHELFEYCFAPLEQHGFLSRNVVEEYHTRRLTHAYPSFRVGYQQHLSKIIEYIDASKNNLWSFGRQGLFAYVNVDEVIWMGLQVASNLSMKEKMNLTSRDLFREFIEL